MELTGPRIILASTSQTVLQTWVLIHTYIDIYIHMHTRTHTHTHKHTNTCTYIELVSLYYLGWRVVRVVVGLVVLVPLKPLQTGRMTDGQSQANKMK